MRLVRAARRRPGLAVALSYLLVGCAALAPSIRPGRTLVAADMLTIVTPYSALPGSHMVHNPLLSDIPFQFFPWFAYLGRALHHAHVPQWNSALLGGVPAMPNGFVSPYYPPTWLAAVLAPTDAYNLFVLLHLVLGALGIYAFSRALGARRLAAWVAGLGGFAASFWVHWSTHLVHLAGFVWLPWALVAAHRLVDKPSARRVVPLAVVVGLWWLGGNPQYAYNGMAVLAAYAGGLVFLRRYRSRADGAPRTPVVRPAIALGGAVALGLILAAPVLAPTASITATIVRSRETLPPQTHVPRSEAIRVLVPDATGSPPDNVFYGSNDELRMDSPFVGVTGFLLALAALGTVAGRGGRRDPARLLLVGAVAVVGVLAYTTLPHRLIFDVVPGYDRFRAQPSRWFSVLPALALPLAALGLHDVLAGDRRSRRAVLIGAVVSIVAIAAWLAWQLTRDDAPRRFFAKRSALAIGVVVLVTAAVWLARRRPVVAVAVLAACALVEIGVFTTNWYPRVDERVAFESVEPARLAASRGGRIARVGERTQFGPFAASVPLVYGLSDIDGQAVLFPKDYDRYRRLLDDYGQYATNVNASPPLLNASLLTSPLLDALDVRSVIADPGVAIPPAYPPLDAEAPVVYARDSPGPAVLVPTATPVTQDEAWRRVADRSWDPTATAAVVGLRSPVAGGRGTVTGGAQGTDAERWDVDAPAGGFLRISANFDTGWSATVDGKAVPVLRADAIFRGVVLGPGRHRVVFSYQNHAEQLGRRAALAAVVALVGLLLPWAWVRSGRRARSGGSPDPTRPDRG